MACGKIEIKGGAYGMEIIIAWHEDTKSYWANCPDWKELMVTEGYTIGEVNTLNGIDEFSLKKMMMNEGYTRIQNHELKDFLGNLTEDDMRLITEED